MKTLLVARAAIWQTREREKLLVGKRKEGSKNYPNQWEFPGGKIDCDEDPILAALRESFEETGLHIIRTFPPTPFEYQYVMPPSEIEGVPDSPYLGWLIHTWVIETVAYRPDLLQAPVEHSAFNWVTLEEATELNLQPQSQFALPLLGIIR